MIDSKDCQPAQDEAKGSEARERRAYVAPRVRSEEAYEKLALASCSVGGADPEACNFA